MIINSKRNWTRARILGNRKTIRSTNTRHNYVWSRLTCLSFMCIEKFRTPLSELIYVHWKVPNALKSSFPIQFCVGLYVGDNPVTRKLHPLSSVWRLVRQRLELTKLTSKKSIPPSPSSVNSARVAGGTAFAPAHSIFPEPQSPVTQLNFPFESSLQRVRPQNRPPQDDGASTALDSPSRRTKPVVDSCATPAFDKMPGQTVYSHLFTIVNVAEAITP